MVKEEEKEEKEVVKVEEEEEEEEEEEKKEVKGNGREEIKVEDQKSQIKQSLHSKSPQLEEEIIKCSLTTPIGDLDELKNTSGTQSSAHSPAFKSRSTASLPQETILQQADNCLQSSPNVLVNY